MLSVTIIVASASFIGSLDKYFPLNNKFQTILFIVVAKAKNYGNVIARRPVTLQ